MKRIITITLLLALILSLSACSKRDEDEFAALRERVSAAGYEVKDAFVDANFKDVVSAFSIKVNFDANTVATIPIILTKSEAAATENCALFGADSIKLPIQNGKIFSYPGRDYPEEVLNLVKAIVNGEEIPKNLKD